MQWGWRRWEEGLRAHFERTSGTDVHWMDAAHGRGWWTEQDVHVLATAVRRGPGRVQLAGRQGQFNRTGFRAERCGRRVRPT